MKNLLLSTLLLGSLVGVDAVACDIHGETGIVEENTMRIPVGRKSINGMTKEVFLEKIEQVTKLYSGVVAERGGILKVRKLWDDATVNAFAKQVKPGEKDSDEEVNNTGKTIYEVNMFGGLARHDAVTPDGFALVVCHELGHHLAGAPRKPGSIWDRGDAKGLRWASNEGQSDYWGTMKCLRKVFEAEGNQAAKLNTLKYDKVAYDSCREANGTDKEAVAICTRTAMAGKSLANLFRELRTITTPLEFTTPDTKVVTTTYHSHPEPQCRLDTYFAGSLCTVNSAVDTDHDNPFVGVCYRGAGDTTGVRPLCWFKPSEYENQ